MSAPIHAAMAAEIQAHLCRKHSLLLTYKRGLAWSLVGVGFDIAKLAGAQIPSGEQFLTGFASVVPLPFAAVVMLPDADLSPSDQTELLAHEAEHGDQGAADFGFCGKYIAHREYRAGTAEAPAYAVSYALRWARTGELPESLAALPSALVWGYDLKEPDVQLASEVLEQRVTEIKHGIIRSAVAREVLTLLARKQPDALHSESLRLIREHDPLALQAAL